MNSLHILRQTRKRWRLPNKNDYNTANPFCPTVFFMLHVHIHRVTATFAHIVIRDSKKHRGNRKIVFFRAGGSAYYTTPTKQDSVMYVGDDLHIKVAFRSEDKAHLFINSLGELNPSLGDPVVEVVCLSPYEHDITSDDMIFEWHYKKGDNGSPSGSRESASSAGYVMAASKRERIVKYQRLEPGGAEKAVVLEMAHIKDKCFCAPHEKTDRNNFLAMSPTAHKMLDGNLWLNPSLIIKIENADTENFLEVESENGHTERLYDVTLRVEYFNPEVAANSMLMFKREATSAGDGITHYVPVKVLDVAAFSSYIKWKANDTLNKWDPSRDQVDRPLEEKDDGDGDESGDLED